MSDLRQVTEFRQREVILCHKVSWIIEIFINYVWIKHPNYLHPSQRKMLLACMHIVAAAIFSKFDVEGEHCSIPFQKMCPYCLNLNISILIAKSSKGCRGNAVKNCVTLNFSSFFNFLSKTSITPDLVNVIKQNLIC